MVNFHTHKQLNGKQWLWNGKLTAVYGMGMTIEINMKYNGMQPNWAVDEGWPLQRVNVKEEFHCTVLLSGGPETVKFVITSIPLSIEYKFRRDKDWLFSNQVRLDHQILQKDNCTKVTWYLPAVQTCTHADSLSSVSSWYLRPHTSVCNDNHKQLEINDHVHK